MAVLFRDLDGFNRVTDDYGHRGGDDLLEQLATRLEDAIREQDTAARIGGDEFGILLEDLETEEQLSRLRELGCRLGQGFLFARPMPAKKFRTELVGQ